MVTFCHNSVYEMLDLSVFHELGIHKCFEVYDCIIGRGMLNEAKTKNHKGTQGGVCMDKTLYDLMDWAGIEEIVYSEAANPHRMLGAHMTPEGMLVQAFYSDGARYYGQTSATGKQYQMEMADETGFFAALIPRKTLADYTSLCFMIMVR